MWSREGIVIGHLEAATEPESLSCLVSYLWLFLKVLPFLLYVEWDSTKSWWERASGLGGKVSQVNMRRLRSLTRQVIPFSSAPGEREKPERGKSCLLIFFFLGKSSSLSWGILSSSLRTGTHPRARLSGPSWSDVFISNSEEVTRLSARCQLRLSLLI